MSSQSLILLDQDNYRQYSMTMDEVSIHSLWDHLRVLYPDTECYSAFNNYYGYVTNNPDSPSYRLDGTITLPNERLGVLSRIRIDPVYTNSVQRISEYRNRLRDPKVQLENTTNPLPIAVRYVTGNGDHYVEHYPFQTTVTFSDQRRKPYITQAQQIKIWIPWTMMRINLRNYSYQYMYAAGRSLMSMDDCYFVAPFPNTYAEGNICWSNSLTDYAGMTYDYSTKSYGVDLKTFYSIAFNEYFSGGWNTDLGSLLVDVLHYQYSAYYQYFDQFPMINKMMHPTPEYIKEHLPQLSPARRLMMANGLLGLIQSRLRSTAYMLYMMSTFTLEETLQFWDEVTSLKSKRNLATTAITTFSDMVAKQVYVHPNSFSHDGIDWGDLSTPVSQQDPLLTNQHHDISNQNMYTYVYNICSNTSETTCSQRDLLMGVADSQLYYTREMHNEMCTDFVNTGLHNPDQRHLYMVDHGNRTWAKIVIPNTEIKQYSQLATVYRVDVNMAHYALSRHRELVTTEASS